MMSVNRWIDLEDFSFELASLRAFGRGVLPASHVSDTIYTLSLWLYSVNEPITVTYDTVEQRDAAYVMIKNELQPE